MKRKWMSLTLLFFSLWASSARAQDETPLHLRLARNLGTGMGTFIRGTFTLHVSGPDNLRRVVFFLDQQVIGEDNASPFGLQFRTDNYEPGTHKLSARGYTDEGGELNSNELTRRFLGQGESSGLTTALVVTLILLVLGGRLLTNWIANRGQGKSGRWEATGMLGGAICPNCGRPYALHFWGLKLMASRLDRCPHCGKWRLVQRASADVLRAAAASFEEEALSHPSESLGPDPGDHWRQQLDDSRFDNSP
jgi:DNA-directed RNA polymerase subunit RPC12/RpoP